MDKLKMKLKQADWWEITYLIIYGAVFTFEFLNTTMFEVKWPPRFAYIFLASTALYTVAKFIWHNTYTKKEMIWAGVILFAFLMPALLTDYRFLWYTGFLIVGAKDIDFDKILKVYLTIGITIMLAAFVASQVGWIENLVFTIYRGDQTLIQNSFGMIYHTDFAAHVFYLSVAAICLAEDKITIGKVINFVLLALFIFDKCAARTSFICLMLMAFVVFIIKVTKKRISGEIIYRLVNCAMFIFAGLFIVLTYMYNPVEEWIVKLDTTLSGRLGISYQAITEYDYKLFGQNIVEQGWGRGGEVTEYFFLDDSYIRIALMYGIVLFFMVLIMFFLSGVKAIQTKRILVLAGIAVIALHSFMEHHLIEIAYNPFLCYLLADSIDKEKMEVSNVS